MTKGIYFLDKNVNLLSDIESFFVVNDMVSYRGGAGLLQQAKNELAGRNDVDVIVISDNLVDATCIEALKALMSHPAKKIVALRNKDEMLRTKIEEHAIVISYPFSCNLIEETIKRITLCYNIRQIVQIIEWGGRICTKRYLWFLMFMDSTIYWKLP